MNTSHWDDGKIPTEQQTPKLPDWAVFNLAENSVASADFFDEQWRVK